jgi:dipeptidyl aminopeptidase/acylaminoacyl peptidase
VLVVHGGPWAREALGYSGETQLLADRGYAVLQVNFRGSTGLGRAVVDGAVGQFGRRMSDDLLDALAWGARAGVVDTTRVCIVGGSYGGYAALVGLTRDAARFRCGASWAGPVDLETLIRAFPPSWGPFLPRSWYRFVGRPDDPTALARMREASPLYQLESARAPLLLFQGANDPRVRTDHAVRVLRAWRARGLPATLLHAANEGHGFNEESTALAVNRALEEFLARHLGGRVESPAPAAVVEVIARLAAAGERLLLDGPPPP